MAAQPADARAGAGRATGGPQRARQGQAFCGPWGTRQNLYFRLTVTLRGAPYVNWL